MPTIVESPDVKAFSKIGVGYPGLVFELMSRRSQSIEIDIKKSIAIKLKEKILIDCYQLAKRINHR